MAFHEVRFPASLSFGSSGGPERRTEIVTLSNGFEERNTPWEASRRRFDAGLGMRSMDDIDALIAFFEARRGPLHGFRWKDWGDWRSCAPSAEVAATDQWIGAGDGMRQSFELLKTYVSGPESWTRRIAKPVSGTVRVAIDGVDQVEGIDWTLDAATGVVAFVVPPGPGTGVTAGFEFDVPVRFDTDRLDISYAGFVAGEVPTVPVVEIRT
ncbi:TIGR02217 family protein [Rhodovulum sp. 12E13]|uniref:DUF2460 domain-containing protein n=1 Tax=Rhodovulum sp. 12E13 TaxID=2203891 RepID=UPI000E120468|nr:DUF2460 domain-containing protein [Rhodovulum sp. 12E13]RDC74453.1 TIGR02217 family protein [Rhodovulum sp. 12E13]